MYYNQEQIYSNRVDASLLSGNNAKFFFHDDIFKSVDWTTEPKKSLKNLYRERAEQLRHNYDYLVLALSGGIDSTNVLETFYYNNIQLDEIVLVGAFSQDSSSGSDEHHNGEIYHSALPLIQSLKLSNTKITLVDYTKSFSNIENLSLIKKYGSDWIKYVGSRYSLTHLWWADIDCYVHINRDKKNGIIFGYEKPIVKWDEALRPYTTFSDCGLMHFGFATPSPGLDKIRFYTAIDTIDLMKKQCHIIKNFYNEYVLNKKTISQATWDKKANLILKRLIYDIKYQISYQSKTPVDVALSIRDRYLPKSPTSNIYKIWLDGAKKITNFKVSNKLIVPSAILSRRYYL